MDREMKKAILEARLEAHRAEHEQRIAAIHARAEARITKHEEKLTAIHARVEARKAEHEEKLTAIHARIEARKAERSHRKAAEPAVNEGQVQDARNQELQAMRAAMMANVPTIRFPEDDPKYNSARICEP